MRRIACDWRCRVLLATAASSSSIRSATSADGPWAAFLVSGDTCILLIWPEGRVEVEFCGRMRPLHKVALDAGHARQPEQMILLQVFDALGRGRDVEAFRQGENAGDDRRAIGTVRHS